MKEITRIEKVYDFNELSDTAKENARRAYLESFRESDMYCEICECRFEQDFPNSDLKVEYSLSYCQGDGLNIYGNFRVKDIINFVRKYHEDYDTLLDKSQKRFLNYLEKQDIIIRNNGNSYYSYYTSKAEDVRYYIELDFEGNYYRDIPYDTINYLANMFDDCFKEYCKTMEEEGYDFFYNVDDEEIIDVWNANEYLGFDINGKPVYV